MGRAGSDDDVAGSLSGPDTGGGVLEADGLVALDLISGRSELVRVCEGRKTSSERAVQDGEAAKSARHTRSGLSSLDGLGGDEDLGGGETGKGDGLGSVEVRGWRNKVARQREVEEAMKDGARLTRSADGPPLLSASLLLRTLAKLSEKSSDSGESDDSSRSTRPSLLSGREDGNLESDDLAGEHLIVLNEAPLSKSVGGSVSLQEAREDEEVSACQDEQGE